jgi:hypothetical protein
MLWRYATVQAGARLNSERRYTMGEPGRSPAASEAVGRFLAVYGPARPRDFAGWAALATPHARRLWDGAGDLAEVRVGASAGWLLPEDVGALGAQRHDPRRGGNPLQSGNVTRVVDGASGAPVRARVLAQRRGPR